MSEHEHIFDGDGFCLECYMTRSVYIENLEAEVQRLKAYKALADEMAEAKRSFHTYFWWTDEMLPDWLTRYDALTKETTT